jgi:hypothetical protein
LPEGFDYPSSDTIPELAWRFWLPKFRHYPRISLKVLITQVRTLSQDLPEGFDYPSSDTIPGFTWRFWLPKFGHYPRICLKVLAKDLHKLSLHLLGPKFRQCASICLDEWMEIIRATLMSLSLDQDINSVLIRTMCLVNDKIKHIGCYRQ